MRSIAQRADVVVVGLGIMGLSTAAELASRGRRVIGIDRFGSGHPLTSSTGASRSIRVAYDRPVYVDLAREAIEAWRRLEHDHGTSLLVMSGEVDLGPDRKLDALVAAMAACDVPSRELDRREIASTFPELRLRAGERAIVADGGTVLAAAGMEVLMAEARSRGVDVSAPERALALRSRPGGVTVVTDRRSIEAGQAVISAGPWTGPLIAQVGMSPSLAPAIGQVTFLETAEMQGRPALSDWEAFDRAGVYGHPVPGIGYKVAFDAGSTDPWDPEATAWRPDEDEERRLLAWLGDRMPTVVPVVALTQRHPWTMTPDGDFVIDRSGPFVVAGGCAGHAFKFGPALGRLIADVVDGMPRQDLASFALGRPSLSDPANAAAPIPR